MKCNQILLFLLILALNSEANDRSQRQKEFAANNYSTRLNNTLSCFRQDFRTKECRLHHNRPLILERSVTTVMGSAANLTSDVFGSVGRLFTTANDEVAPDHISENQELQWNGLKQSVKKKIEDESMHTCQKVCLAKCITSRLFMWIDGNQSRYDLMCNMAGNCHDFSEMGVEIMTELGLTATVRAGKTLNYVDPAHNTIEMVGHHAVVGVEVNGTEYLVEPQNDSCDFYQRDNQNFDPEEPNKIGEHSVSRLDSQSTESAPEIRNNHIRNLEFEHITEREPVDVPTRPRIHSNVLPI